MEPKDLQEIEVLLVEDDIHDAELTIRALKKKKLANHIIHLHDGQEALDFLFCARKYKNRNKNTHPKVMFLDLKLPKVSGLEVLKEIKSNDKTNMVPVVILTSSEEHPDVAACYKLGANSYIVKPVDFEKFTKSIEDLGLYWLIMNKVIL